MPIEPDSELEYQMMEPETDGASQASSHAIRRYLGFLQKFWWIPLVTLILGAVGGAMYVLHLSPIFVSKSSMWETVKLTLPGGGLFTEDSQDFLGTQSELMQSTTLRNQALALLRVSSDKIEIPLDADRQPIPVSIHVSGNPKSSVFTIEANSSNPAFTQNYLNALMQAYLDYKRNVRKVISGDTLQSISEQVQQKENDLKLAQEELSTYERTNNMVVMQDEGVVLGGYLTRLKTQLSDLELEERILDAAEQGLNTGTNNPGQTSAAADVVSNSILPSTSVVTADQQAVLKDLELLKSQRDRLSKTLRPKHPRMVQLNEQIERAEKLKQMYDQQTRDQLLASRQANRLRIDNLKTSIRDWENRLITANGRIAEAERLKANVQRIQSLYDRLDTLVQNVGISRNIDQETLAILERASPPKRSYTREKNGLRLAAVAGLLSGLGIVFLIGLKDDRFTSVTEVTTAVGDSVVGMLPHIANAKDRTLPLLELNDSRHLYAESYRSLRSALLFLTPGGERPKVILVTSAMPNEGKTTIAANLARTLALAGSRVLLVDGDLRKGRLHHLLEMENDRGLVEALRGDCAPEQLIQANALPNFYFVARGGNAGNPGDLFLSSNLDDLIARWRQEFDYVLIDSTPVFAADDASCLAPKVDGTLFVVRSHSSSARAVREALGLLARRQARVLGVVFNGVNTSERSFYYYKYPEYYSTAVSVRAANGSGTEPPD